MIVLMLFPCSPLWQLVDVPGILKQRGSNLDKFEKQHDLHILALCFALWTTERLPHASRAHCLRLNPQPCAAAAQGQSSPGHQLPSVKAASS